MVVAGLIVVLVVSVVVARAGLAYLDGAPSSRPVPTATAPSSDSTCDAGEPEPPAMSPSWERRGFDAAAAHRWMNLGFDPDHAFLFRTLDIDARTAVRLRTAGLDDSALVSLVEAASFAGHHERDQLLALVEHRPQLAPQAFDWIRLGASTTEALAAAAAGFTASAFEAWRGAGWDLGTALPWFVARFEPVAAVAWRTAGFGPDEADEWKREHFGVRQASDWRRLGDTPPRARAVERQFADARVTVADGLRWLDLGLSVDEICAGWPAMAAGDDARSWRAAWSRTALAPNELSAWHAHFDRDDARRWLAAGVRDASHAVRLRARGFGPDDVASVARDRLADVFNSVPVTRDDVLSAAGHLARAGASPEIHRRLVRAAAVNGDGDAQEVGMDLIEDVLDELQRLDDLGQLGAPHAVNALARRLERGLVATALVGARSVRAERPRAS